jgi:CPA2 family monovalent cation:H+ antiporter-2
VAAGLGKAALILVPFAVLAHRVMPRLLGLVARTRSDELFLLVALAIGLGTAALSQAVGLSLALGAFLAGLIVSEAEFAHETAARVLSLRDAFVALFFVTMGVLIDPRTLVENVPLLGAFVGLILVGKPLLWTALVRVLGYPLRTAVLVGLGLSQIGEFSFVLVGAARAAGLVGAEVYQATLAASLLTILANAGLVRLAPRLVARLSPGPAPPETAGAWSEGPSPVVLAGFGRVGGAIGEALDTFGLPYVVIERDPDVVRALRGRGVAAIYGDASQPSLLLGAGAGRAPLVVVALPDADRAWLTVRHSRALSPAVPILVRAHSRTEHEALRAAGATIVVQPEIEAAATFIRHALARLDLPADRLVAYLDRFRDAMNPEADPLPGATPGLPEVREVTLPEGALAGRSLREARIRERFGVTVVAVASADGTVVANPSPDTTLRAGHRLRLFGLSDQVDAFLAAAARPGDDLDGPG